MSKLRLSKYHVLTAVSALLLFAVIFPTADTRGSAIILNDDNQSINMRVDLAKDTTGVVALRLAQANVRLQDEAGNIVFQMADARVRRVELSLMPNTGAHYMTVERLAGAIEAAVDLQAQTDMTGTEAGVVVTDNTLLINQRRLMQLSTKQLTGSIVIQIPDGIIGEISARYNGANVSAKLMDSEGVVIAAAGGGDIDGLQIVLEGGEYLLALEGKQLQTETALAVQVTTADSVADHPLMVPVVNAGDND